MSRLGVKDLALLLVFVQASCSGFSSSSQSPAPRPMPPSAPETPAALTIVTTSILPATVGASFSQTMAASNGTGPYTWSVASGQLPSGIALTPASGALAGTPSQSGQFTFTVEVADSSSPVQTSSVSYMQTVSVVELDSYGGLVSMPSPKAPTPTHWRVEKFGNKWLFVDPDNNGFYMTGMDLVLVPTTVSSNNPSCNPGGYSYIIAQKYGDTCGNWVKYLPQLNRRLLAFNFNTIGFYSGSTVPYVTNAAWPGDHTIPVKMPFVQNIRPGYYSTFNPEGYSLTGLTLNVAYALSLTYLNSHGYVPQIMPDWCSPHLLEWLDADLVNDYFFKSWSASPYAKYLIGLAGDDSDQWYGMAIGPAFPAQLGHTNPNLAWLVMSSSPQLVANVGQAQLYTSDTTNHMKVVWQQQLEAKYGTIAALNTAWGSNYSAFGSSGTAVTGASLGTGDGSTLSFTTTLANLPTYNTIQILVGGKVVAGDIGQFANWGGWAGKWFYGPNIDNTGCSINWSTGQITLKFSAANAPAAGAPITVNYIYGGWGSGTGLMDEDARVSHQGWTGKDWTNLSDVNANLKADLSTLLYSIAYTYFSGYRTHLQAQYPNLMFFGPESMSTWGGMPPQEVLQAANGTVDAMELDVGVNPVTMTQDKMNFIYSNYGDHPFFTVEFRHANPDSQLYAVPNIVDGGQFSTQQARGQDYYNETTQYISWAYPNGGRPFVGQLWFQLNDNVGEQSNWGIVTFRDNLYNGKEAQVAAGTDPSGYPTGGEARDYGDVLDLVNQAHQYILANLPAQQ